MRRSTFSAAAALGVATVFLAAPLANAAPANFIVLVPSQGAPGATVAVHAGCDQKDAKDVTLKSEVLEEITLKGLPVEYGTDLRGNTKVKKDAKAGTYSASIKCGEQTLKARFKVLPAPVETKPPATPRTRTSTPAPTSTAPKPSGQVVVKPKGAADTGEGDIVDTATVNTAAVQPASGPGAGTFVLGGAALLATAGAGAFAFRRLRKES